MSAQNFAQAIGAGATITLPAGRFFMVKSATSNLDIVTQGNPGSPVRFNGVGAGSRFGPVGDGEGWKTLNISSAAAQNVEIIISDDGQFDVANTVNVAGAVNTIEQPSSAVADTADAALASGGTANIAANLSRKRITIGNQNNSTNIIRVSNAGTTGRGIEIQPGQYAEFKTTAALIVRNDNGFGTAATATWYAEEET